MKKSEKRSFSYVWDLIELSVFIIVGYQLLDLAFSISLYVDKVIPASIFGILILVFAFGTIGYNGVKRNEESNKIAKYGAYSGLITGFVGAIIGILMFYFFPEKIALAIQQAVEQGADAQAAQTFMKIGIYLNLIIGPAINAGIGALVSWISGLVFKKK